MKPIKKALIPITGLETMWVQKAIEEAAAAGISEILVLIEQERGMGKVLSNARSFLDQEPFALLIPNDLIFATVPCIKQMADKYQTDPGTIVAVRQVPRDEYGSYILVDPALKKSGDLILVRDLVEGPLPEAAPSELAVVGRYIIEPEIFESLTLAQPEDDGETGLVDGLRLLAARKLVYAYKFSGKHLRLGERAGRLTRKARKNKNLPE